MIAEKFITFEGLDKTGKTTHANFLKNWLIGQGIETHLFREPGGCEFSELCRDILLKSEHELCGLAETFLLLASRSQLVHEKIVPALKAGSVVICDRFIDSTIAYQGHGKGVSKDFINHCNLMATNWTIPWLTFVLDAPVGYVLSRMGEQKDKIERLDVKFFERVRQGFIPVRPYSGVVVIDATLPAEMIQEKIIQYVRHDILKDGSDDPRRNS